MKRKKMAISVKFLIWLLILLAVMSISFSYFRARGLRSQEAAALKQQYEHLKEAHINSLTRVLWLTDYAEVQQQLNYISNFSFVDYAELIDEDGKKFSSGVKLPEQILVDNEDLFYNFNDVQLRIGEISLFFDYGKIDRDVNTEITKIILMFLCTAFFLSVSIFILFKIIIGDHIKKLSSLLVSDNVERLDCDLKLSRKNIFDDELSILIVSINELRRNWKGYILNEEKLKKSLENEVEFRTRLFAIISHDLRGPLSSYRGLTQMLLETSEGSLSENNMMVLKEMYKSSDALTLLVENLLEWSSFERGNKEVNLEKIDITNLPEKISHLYGSIVIDKRIDLKVSSESGIYAYADINIVETILRNLISNAVKFTAEGGRINIAAELVDGHPVLSVEDSGLGIPKEIMDKLNNHRPVKSRRGTSNEKGTGLGLQLSLELARIINSELHIDSAEGRGTVIKLILPPMPK